MKRLKQLLAFNRGVVSKIGLARIDIERMAMSCEQMLNWIPRVLGSMMLRPGMQYLDNTVNNFFSRNIPFIFSADDTALLQFSTASLRIRVDDQLINIAGHATTIGNDGFDVGLSPWVDNSDTGGIVSAISLGYVRLSGDGTDFGRIYQSVNVSGPFDEDVEHHIFLDIEHGSVLFKVGTANGSDDLIEEQRLGRGIHYLEFTPPAGNFYVTIANETIYWAQVAECSIAAGGIMSLQTPYTDNDLPYLRHTQSGDVMYLACKNSPLDAGLSRNAEILKKVERRGSGRSWSLVTYEPEDGPFLVQNTSGVTLRPAALNGNTTLIAEEGGNPVTGAFFDNVRHVNNYMGALFRIASNGQTVTKQISSADDWTDPPIRVTGSENARQFQIIIEGTFTATVKLQFAFSPDGPWNDQGQTWSTPVSTTYNDGQDGSIIYYRIGVDAGDYTSGTVTCTLVYANGSIEGIARVTGWINGATAQVAVLSPFGSLDASKDWWEGAWSYKQGFPTAVELHEGRLSWAGNDRVWMSESDAYENFSDTTEGDAAAIDKQIGSGPIRVIHWLLSMGRMMIGTADNSANVAAAKMDGNNPLSARSSNFDEPLTPFNFNIKQSSPKAVFVDRTEQRLYEMLFNVDTQDYSSIDLSIFAPDFNEVGITQIAVQMKPDVRVHCVRQDGTVGVLVYDRLENVICWYEVTSPGAGGEIEDVAVLPGKVEDQVYYIVKRTINSSTERHICKWAKESEARGGTINKIADSFVQYSGAPTTTPFTTELVHLQGETVEIWADGLYVGTDTVTAGGALTSALAVAASEVVVGLGYTARFKSAKLGEMDGIGLLERKKIARMGFLAKWLHHLGLRYGPDFTNLRDLPQTENGKPVATGTIWEDYHEDNFAFGGDWDTDSRICLEAKAPLPATLLAAIAEIESVENMKRR
jgi:hypothetical protein